MGFLKWVTKNKSPVNKIGDIEHSKIVIAAMNLRGCVENELLVTQGAQSSDSDASDFTGEEGAVVELSWLPPGGLHVSRHR